MHAEQKKHFTAPHEKWPIITATLGTTQAVIILFMMNWWDTYGTSTPLGCISEYFRLAYIFLFTHREVFPVTKSILFTSHLTICYSTTADFCFCEVRTMNLALLTKKWLNHKQTGDYMITEEIRALLQFKNPTSCSLLQKKKEQKIKGKTYLFLCDWSFSLPIALWPTINHCRMCQENPFNSFRAGRRNVLSLKVLSQKRANNSSFSVIFPTSNEIMKEGFSLCCCELIVFNEYSHLKSIYNFYAVGDIYRSRFGFPCN